MASSKARQGSRPASAKGGRPARGSAAAARTAVAVPATPTNPRPARQQAGRPAVPAPAPEPDPPVTAEEPEPRPGPPLWLQVTSLVLAVLGLAVSAYETYAHFTGSHLAGCPAGGSGPVNCTAVITSSQSMVFGVIPVAILGLAFYVFAVAIFSPWAWRMAHPAVHWLRLGSMIVGIGFVLYLVYAELFEIDSICEYCTGVHVITFLLFGITIFCAAVWGLGKRPADER